MREIFHELALAKERTEDDYDRGVTLAYLTAALTRATKLPPLQTLQTRSRRPQTARQQRTMLEILSAQYGGPVRRVKRRREGRA